MGNTDEFDTDPGIGSVRAVRVGLIAPTTGSLFRLVLLLFTTGFWFAWASHAAVPFSSEAERSPPPEDLLEGERIHKQARETQELYRVRVAIPDAVQETAPATGLARPRVVQPVPSFGRVPPSVLWIAFLAAGISVAPLVLVANRRWNRWLGSPERQLDLTATVLAEDPSLQEFFRALRVEPLVASTASQAGQTGSLDRGSGSTRDSRKQAREFLVKQVAILRSSVSELGRAPDGFQRLRTLREILQQLERVKEGAGGAGTRPVWLLAFGLQGLLGQLVRNLSNFTPSALRTTAAAVDLLGDLCLADLPPDLATNPPVRLLAVDDDPISRRAVSLALRKAFNEPDLAPDGQHALVLATQHTYDVIFLDVEMPGMDGFELCSKVHETTANSTTPVVFVTCHSDFDSRARSCLAGGHDLMAKPFLIFEITVKALSLVLRTRLARVGSKQASSGAEESARPTPADDSRGLPTLRVGPPQPPSAFPAVPLPDQPSQSAKLVNPADRSLLIPGKVPGISTAVPVATGATPQNGASAPADGQSQAASFELAQAFFARSPERLQGLRRQLTAARDAAEPADRHRLLSELLRGAQAMGGEAAGAQLGAALRLSSALEALLRKLLERPKLATPSTFDAAVAGVDAIDLLCKIAVDASLEHLPVRLLVVDDDPVARRAIGGVLQLAFGRPDSADSGEAALALASEKSYDLIFLDVIMPGMDGYATCDRLRQIPQNSRTPIVFITSQDGADSRVQAQASGGSGFVPKPVISSQITLVALSFLVRTRLALPMLDTANLGFPDADEPERVEPVLIPG